MKRVSFYVVLEPRHDFAGRLIDVKADRLVATRPQRMSSRHVAVKFNVELDDSLFEQFLPEVTVTIDDGRVLITPTVTVESPQLPEDTEEAATEEAS